MYRESKQCKEHWKNVLDPEIDTSELTDQEKKFIHKKVEKYGRRWAKIAKRLDHRTADKVKNFWLKTYGKKKKVSRSIKKNNCKKPIEIKVKKFWVENHAEKNSKVASFSKKIDHEQPVLEPSSPSLYVPFDFDRDWIPTFEDIFPINNLLNLDK